MWAGVASEPQHLPQGAIAQPDGTVVWRVWAPFSEHVSLVTGDGQQPMTAEGFGYFVHRQEVADEGLRYTFKLADGRETPDPASRWQPDGPQRASAVFRPELYTWTDVGWRGVRREDLVIYELHVGTFTPEGTLDAIIPPVVGVGFAGRHGVGAYASGAIFGRTQLGIRRCISLRRAEQLRWTACAAASDQCGPPQRAGGADRRRS